MFLRKYACLLQCIRNLKVQGQQCNALHQGEPAQMHQGFKDLEARLTQYCASVQYTDLWVQGQDSLLPAQLARPAE